MCKKIFILFLAALLLNVNFPGVTFSQVGQIDGEIAQDPPEMRSTPEEDIPVETVKKWPAWVWVGLGVLVVGAAVGIAAAAGGGGGGGGSSNASPATTASGGKGSVAVGW